MEKIKDKEMVDEAAEVFKEEQSALKDKNKQRKGMYKQIWMEQMKLNDKAREVHKIFN